MTPEEKKLYNKIYYTNNKNKILNSSKQYAKDNYNKVSDYQEKYRNENINKNVEYQKKYRNDNKEILNQYDKLRYETNTNRKNLIKEYKISENGKAKRRETRKITINDKWRSLLYSTLKRMNKSKEGHTIDILGYSALELKQHIEKLFTEGMSWDNHGEWHVDHIKPVSSFKKDELPCVVNSLSNLQPLWAIDNLIKSNKIL